MHRKTALLCICMLLTAAFGGCDSSTATTSGNSEVLPEATAETEAVSRNLYYAAGNGTTDAAELGSFRAQLETNGYTWTEISLLDIPADADALILNSPTEDITTEEMDALDAYMDAGGHLLLLLPACEEEVRFKNLSRFLEPFCIAFDYDRISETDTLRTVDGDPYFIQADMITYPDNMPLYSEAASTGTPYLRNARSFYFVYQDHFSVVKQDVMLKTSATVIGEPWGGAEDDPLTYEGTALDVMGFARYETRGNASVVFVGASDFLTDACYEDASSETMLSLVYSALDWFMLY